MLGVFIGDVLHVGAYMYGARTPDPDDFKPVLIVFQYPAWGDARAQGGFRAYRTDGDEEKLRKEATEAFSCKCPCHHRGDSGQGYSWRWDDELGIRHEDWVTCGCTSANPLSCDKEEGVEGVEQDRVKLTDAVWRERYGDPPPYGLERD